MKKLIVLALAGLVVASTANAGGGGPGAHQGAAAGLRGLAYFAVSCGFSHRNQDDPIVFPGLSGRSHDHTFFGNRATNAASTPQSLLAAGRTTCRLRADTAAYWAPTLFLNGSPVEPRGATVYYIRRTIERVDPFPAGLMMIAGDGGARSAQSQNVTFWSCNGRARSSTIPTCSSSSFGRRSLNLQVNFRNCWDGLRLDSVGHLAHMAYSVDGVCPASHPVEVPAISLVINYGIAGGPGAELSSGGQFSGHADFVNAWDQRVLTQLVNRYLNRRR